MSIPAREGLIRRLVEALEAGRPCVVLGGPGMGKTSVARFALESLASHSPERAFSLRELPDDESACAAALAEPLAADCIYTGGLPLARALGHPDEDSTPGALRRFPLLPLVRRDLERWAARASALVPRSEMLRAVAATGGHPALFARWLELRRAQPDPDAIEKLLLESMEPLFLRMDAELSHPELARPYAWLAEHGASAVAVLRKFTGANKAVLDRLVMAGPVTRTLGESAEVRIACALYTRRRSD